MSKLDLRNIATSGTVSDKAHLVDTLGALYLVPDEDANPRERALTFEILRHVVHDVEMQVRRKLAIQLADKADPPHDLIVMLANDVIEVAFPVLENSPVLTDQDLIDLVLERTAEHREAIAGRETLSEPVSQSIVRSGDAAAIATLLNNGGARFDTETLDRVIDLSMQDSDYQELMISRKDLPESIAKRLYSQVSDVLRAYLAQSFPNLGGDLEVAMSDAVERALAEDQGTVPTDFAAPEWQDSQLPTALVHALEMDDILHFEDLFQRLTQLETPQVTRALYDLGMEGLAIACKAVDLDRDIFGKIFCRLHGERPLTRFRDSAKFTRGMAYFDSTPKENAFRVLEDWRSEGAKDASG